MGKIRKKSGRKEGDWGRKMKVKRDSILISLDKIPNSAKRCLSTSANRKGDGGKRKKSV